MFFYAEAHSWSLLYSFLAKRLGTELEIGSLAYLLSELAPSNKLLCGYSPSKIWAFCKAHLVHLHFLSGRYGWRYES